MRLYQLLLASLLTLSGSVADATTGSNCAHWIGEYVATLSPSDSFTGNATRLHLSVDRRGISWSVSGENVPEIVLTADRFRCAATSVSGSFSGTAQLVGNFRLTKRGGVYVFDASRVGNEETAPMNYIGYVPNRAVRMQKVR